MRTHNQHNWVPFEESLIFNAPLTNGDLTDHVNGLVPTTDSGCSVTWDSTYNMYRMYSNGAFKGALKYPNSDIMKNKITPENGLTLYFEGAQISGTNLYSCWFTFPIMTSNSYMYGINFRAHGYDYAANTNTGIHKFALTWTPNGTINSVGYVGNIDWFRDGVLIKDYTSTFTFPFNNLTGVGIGVIQNQSANLTVVGKDFRIYNKIFTSTELNLL